MPWWKSQAWRNCPRVATFHLLLRMAPCADAGGALQQSDMSDGFGGTTVVAVRAWTLACTSAVRE